MSFYLEESDFKYIFLLAHPYCVTKVDSENVKRNHTVLVKFYGLAPGN